MTTDPTHRAKHNLSSRAGLLERPLPRRFTCVSVDLIGSRQSDKPEGRYSTRAYAGQLSAFLGVIGAERAHVACVSLGAAVATQIAARYPERVRSLSRHKAWDRTDAYLRTVVEM